MMWCNGALLPADQVRIAAHDRGFLLGDGVFETIRVMGGAAEHLDRHLSRLRRGAAVLGIPIPYDDAVLGAAVAAVLASGAVSEGAVRLTLTRGPAPRGLATPAVTTPTLLVAAQSGRETGGAVRLVTARCTRRNEHSPLSQIKSLNYLDNILARREAEALGADDALILNTVGRVAESTVANVLVLVGSELWTPPVADGALPGIARGRLLERGSVVEREILPARISGAESLFLCNSLGVRPVSSLDGRDLRAMPDLLRTLSRELLAVGRT